MKKLLAFVLSLMVMTTTVSSIVFAESLSNEYADVITEKIKGNHYEAFVSMGLASEEYVRENLELPITRGDFAILLAKLLNYTSGNGELVATEKKFSDVDIHHYAAGGVQFLFDKGIVRGCGDGEFCVDRVITAEEIAAMVVRVMGYDILQDMTGYSSVNQVMANIRGRYTGDVTLEQCFEILYKALFEQTITLNQIKDSGVTYTLGDTFLKEIMELDYFDGVLQEVGGKSLYSAKGSEDVIVVDNRKLKCDTEIPADLLGLKIRVFYKDGDLGYEVAAVECLENEALIIDVRAYESYSDNTINYYDNSNKLRKAKLVNKKDILYNTFVVNDIESNIPQYGKIKLINNGFGSEYDVVMIFGYDSAIVSRVSEIDGIIQFKNHAAINLNEYEKAEIVDGNGNRLKVSDLSEGTAVCIYTHEKEYVRIEASTLTVEGKIDSVRDDFTGWKKFVIEGKEYFAYEGYLSNTVDFRIGQTVTLLLDAYGRIAGITSVGSNEWKIGYIMSVKLYEDDYECLLFKILNQNGHMEKIQTVNKIVLDDEKREAAHVLEKLNIVYQNFEDEGRDNNENVTTRLMRYFVNDDGKITKIDTPTKVSLLETEGVRVSENNKLLMRVKGRLHRPESGFNYKIDYPENVTLMGEVDPNTNNMAFVVPLKENTDPDEDEDYQVTTMEALKDVRGGVYYLSAYNYDPDSLKTDILVIRKGTGTNSQSNIIVIDGVKTVYDPKTSEIKTEVTGYVGTSKQTFTVNARNSTVNVEKISVGDVLSYKTQNNEIVISDLIWRNDGSGALKEPGIFSEDGSFNYYSEFRVLMGEIMRVDGNKALLDLGENRYPIDLFTLPEKLVVYGGNSKSEPCYIADSSTILTQQGGKGDTVLVAQTKRGGVAAMIVIRK